jgi:sugar phosphate isomerase/epimerase
MNTIYLPTFAAFRGDVETIFGTLESEVLKKFPGEFNVGLEIGGKASHFKDAEALEKIVKNINEIARGVPTIVHGFSGIEIYTEGTADMSKEVGLNLLKTYIALGKKLGSGYVHVHGAVGYKGINNAPENKVEVLRRVKANLLEGLKISDGINIGIENIPTPSCCDFETNPLEVWSDYVEQPQDCWRIVKGTELKTTLDVAHYATNREGYIDLIKGVEFIEKYLGHLHIGDVSGYWKPYKSRCFDGVIPGEGRIGKDSFAHFFKYIKENHPNVGICLEVANKDFKNPEEFRESIKRVCGWLRA